MGLEPTSPFFFWTLCIYIYILGPPSTSIFYFSSISRGLNTEIALRRAKENVEKHYAVVGVLEELNKTLTVLEHYVPRFFKGAKDIYYSKF